jgi:DNA-binding SARP family transcriptional activator
MEFRILGPIEAYGEGKQVPVGGAKHRALLAVLLLNANRVVSRDRLVDALWEEEPPETAHKAVQVYVSQLRKLLGSDLLLTRPPGYLLQVEPGMLDLDRFEAVLQDAREADPGTAANKLREALALFRGRPLADFANDRFAQAEIARLEELRMTALEERIEADLALGRHAALVGELEAVVAEHPLRERLLGQLMLALYRSGRQAEALEAYQAARRALVEELGINPGRALQEIERSILLQDSSLDAPTRNAERVAPEPSGGFVGRERELGELMGAFEDALAGRGRLVLIVGEPGIGKSRLADELVGEARARGAQVLVGRCWEAGGAPAYWPWVQALRGYVRGADPEVLRAQLGIGAADLAQLLPDVSELFPEVSASPSTESEGARFRLFDATAAFLKSIAEARPLVLVLDDVHAADAPSLLLLRFLARELGESRILLAAAYRDVDPTLADPLAAAASDLIRQPVTRRVELVGLTRPDVARLVELTAGLTPTPELVAGIWEETEGNPLFVDEVVRLLAQEGLLGGGRVDVDRIGVPHSVREVIGRRLRRLSEGCTRIVTLAAVLGREFGLMALQSVSALPLDELLKGLDEAMTARVVAELPGAPGRLRFAHALIRDALYEDLTEVRRIGLHRLAGEALEGLYGANPDPHLAELAHHFFLAAPGGETGKAVEYARRAADRAVASLAYEEAVRLLSLGLEALELDVAPDETTRCELLLSLGEAELRAGDSLAAKRAFLEAAGIARRLHLPHELARAATGYGGRIMYARAGDDDRLVPLLEEGLAALAQEDVELRARLLARLAGALRDEHTRDRRDRLSREAVELARRSGNPAALAYALDGRAAAIMAPDTVVESLALGNELREVGERIGDAERVLQGHWHRIIAQILVGEVSDAEADLDVMSHIAEELRQPVQLWQVYAAQGMLALAAGGLSEAEEFVSRAFALGERAQPEMAIPVYRLQRHTLCDLRGGLEEVVPAIYELAAEYPARPVFRCVLAHVYAQLGRTDDARREFENMAREEFSGLPFDMEWLYGMSLLVETSALLGDTDSAPVLYGLLVPWAAFNATDHPEGIRGSVSRYLGLLATTMERWSEAALHFEEALEMNERMGARPWLAHTQHDYARMLLARDGTGDAEHARELIERALATYQELGMDSYAARASKLGREAAVSTR